MYLRRRSKCSASSYVSQTWTSSWSTGNVPVRRTRTEKSASGGPTSSLTNGTRYRYFPPLEINVCATVVRELYHVFFWIELSMFWVGLRRDWINHAQFPTRMLISIVVIFCDTILKNVLKDAFRWKASFLSSVLIKIWHFWKVTSFLFAAFSKYQRHHRNKMVVSPRRKSQHRGF